VYPATHSLLSLVFEIHLVTPKKTVQREYQTVAMLISAQYYIPKKFRLISSFEGPVGFKRKIKKILN